MKGEPESDERSNDERSVRGGKTVRVEEFLSAIAGAIEPITSANGLIDSFSPEDLQKLRRDLSEWSVLGDPAQSRLRKVAFTLIAFHEGQ
jgi:hypothetical protein